MSVYISHATVEAAVGALFLLGPCLGAGMFVWRQCVSLDGKSQSATTFEI